MEVKDIAIGPEVLDLADHMFAHQETILQQQIGKLANTRTILDIDADVMDILTAGLQNGEVVDLNRDEGIKRRVLCIHRLYPHLFDRVIQGFPDGILNQPLAFNAQNIEEFLDHALDGVDLSSVHILPLQHDDIDTLMRGLDHHINMESSEVNQIAFSINRLYGDREQIVKIMHEILRQMSELLKSINRSTGAH